MNSRSMNLHTWPLDRGAFRNPRILGKNVLRSLGFVEVLAESLVVEAPLSFLLILLLKLERVRHVDL